MEPVRITDGDRPTALLVDEAGHLLVRLDDDEVERIAQRVVELLRAETVAP
jgi:hypothetical protein